MAAALKVTPPAPKVTTAAAASAIAERLKFEDQVASFNRAQIHAMMDGQAPFDPARRKEQGLEDLANINFLGAQAKRRDALAAYVDMTDSVEFLAEFILDIPDDNQRVDNAYELAVAHKWLMGEWDFENRIMMLADGFIVDGISVALRNDPWDFRWEVAKLSDFKLPRRTKVGEEHIKLCMFSDTMDVDDLWEKIKNPKDAKRRGWNITACQKQIAMADKSWEGGAGRSIWNRNWEKFQELVKENGYCGYASYNGIEVEKLVSKESDGSYSLHLIPANGSAGETNFLYKRIGRFAEIGHIMTVFTSGVGNGTYHSIRSMGYDIFPFEQAMDRLRCKLLDGTALAGSIVAQPKDPAALENFQMQSVGGFMLVQGDVTFPVVPVSNVATQVLPVLDTMDRQLSNNSGRYQSRSITPDGSKERTLGEVNQQLSKEAVLSTSEMILFYRPLRRVYKEDMRRAFNKHLTANDPGGKLVFEFRRKLLKAGVTEKMWSKITDVRPVRAIGNGSPAQRIQAQDRILSLSPQYDEVGRQIALYEATAVTPGVGFANAKRYVRPAGERPPPDVEVASVQNVSFAMGMPQPVLGTDNHWIHCSIHLDYLDIISQQVQEGQIALDQGVTTLNVGLQHVYQHYEPLSQDTGRVPEAKAVRQKMQNIGAIAQQQGQKLDRMHRQAMQAQQTQQSQPPAQSEADPAAEQQQQLSQNEEEFQQGMRHRDEQQQQRLRTNDLVAAQKLTLERIAALDKSGNGSNGA